jgi:hypothetical protein
VVSVEHTRRQGGAVCIAPLDIVLSEYKTVELSRFTEIGCDQPIVVSEGRCASSVIAGFEIDLAAVFAEGVAM